MQNIEIKVDKDELPSSCSAAKVFEDGAFSVFMGGGSAFGDQYRSVVHVHFDDLGIMVVGGQSLIESLKSLPKNEWASHVLAYVVMRTKSADLLRGMSDHAFARGVEYGKREKMAEICQALGIER